MRCCQALGKLEDWTITVCEGTCGGDGIIFCIDCGGWWLHDYKFIGLYANMSELLLLNSTLTTG